MAAPRYLIKSDQAGDMLTVTDESRVHRSGGESFEYSDEKKAAEVAISAAVARLRGDKKPPVAPFRDQFDGGAAYSEAWDAYSRAVTKWRNDIGNAIKTRHMTAARKAFDARIAALPITKIRVDVGDNIPGMAGNQSKRVRRLTPLDARALDRIERQIVDLQTKRAALIWDAYQRGEHLTPGDIVAMADVPHKRKQKMVPHRRHDLDGIHTVTSYSAGRRSAVA